MISLQTPGGGGYGNPNERDAESVRLDVIRGKVSAKSAEQDYGVILNEGGKIDQQRTELLRRSRKTGL